MGRAIISSNKKYIIVDKPVPEYKSFKSKIENLGIPYFCCCKRETAKIALELESVNIYPGKILILK